MQQKALSYGFRPGNPAVGIQSGDGTDPFTRYASYGIKVDIPPVATIPDGVVIRNLLTLWSRDVAKR